MTPLARAPACVLALALLVVLPRVAAAEPADEKAARALFKDDNARLETGDFVGALDKFRAAYEKWPNAKILLNTAAALRKLGRFAEAADTYARYLDDPAADPARAAEVDKLLGELDANLARLTLPPSGPELKVTLDGRQLPEGTRELRVDPGTHVAIAEAPGAPPVVLKLELAAGEARTLDWAAAQPADPPGGGPDLAAMNEATPPSSALLQASAPRLSARSWPLEVTRRPHVLPRGLLDAHLDFTFSNSTPYTPGARPNAFAPRIYYGITDRFTTGINHQYGLCWGGDYAACYRTYDDIAFDNLFSLWRGRGGTGFAVRGGLTLYSFDPVLAGLDLGGRLKGDFGRFGVQFDPRIRFGLTHREDFGFREALFLPLELQLQVTRRVALTTTAYMQGPIDHFSDLYSFALGAGATVALSGRFDFTLRYVADNLREADGVDFRTIEAGVGLRL